MLRYLLIVMLVLPAVIATCPAQQSYRIKLNRPHKAGDRFTMSTLYIFRQTMSVTSRGAELQHSDSSFDVTLKIDAEIVDPNLPTLLLTVQRCDLKRPGQDAVEVIVPPGTQCIFNPEGGGKRITPRDSTIDAASLELLDEAFPGTLRNLADDVIGTSEPQRVGATWKIDAAKVAQGLTTEGAMIVNGRDIAASAKLEKVRTDLDVPTMTVQANVSVRKFALPQLEGFQLKKSHAEILVSGDMPLDESKGVVGNRLTMIVAVNASSIPVKGRPPLDLAMQFTRVASTSFEYAK